MDQTLRLAADRVKAWHLERFLAHVEPPEPTMPPPQPLTPERVAPISDPPEKPDDDDPDADPTPSRGLTGDPALPMHPLQA
jgi:hypothetical protein